MLKLDFSLDASARTELVNRYIKENPSYKFSPNELDTIANYMLYGKDENGHSPIDDRLYSIAGKYGSYKRKSVESLEGMVAEDGATFEPRTYRLGEAPKYAKRKPASPRAGEAPGIDELDKTIEGIEQKEKQKEGYNSYKPLYNASGQQVAPTRGNGESASPIPSATYREAYIEDYNGECNEEYNEEYKEEYNEEYKEEYMISHARSSALSSTPSSTISRAKDNNLTYNSSYNEKCNSEYKRRHLLIALRRERYYLKESHNPYICPLGGQAQRPRTEEVEPINWDAYMILPLGLYGGNTSRFEGIGPQKTTKWDTYMEYYIREDSKGNPKESSQENLQENSQPFIQPSIQSRGRIDEKDSTSIVQDSTYAPSAKYKKEYILDFADPRFIYKLADRYTDLAIQAEQDGTSIAHALLDTLDYYVKATNLSPERQLIWDYKIAGASNDAIRKELVKIGKKYQVNYISTIFKQMICKKIAGTAKLKFDEYVYRDNGEMWKTCSKCGKRKLKDTRCFMRKGTSSDGYSGFCKDCEREKREARKRAKT